MTAGSGVVSLGPGPGIRGLIRSSRCHNHDLIHGVITVTMARASEFTACHWQNVYVRAGGARAGLSGVRRHHGGVAHRVAFGRVGATASQPGQMVARAPLACGVQTTEPATSESQC